MEINVHCFSGSYTSPGKLRFQQYNHDIRVWITIIMYVYPYICQQGNITSVRHMTYVGLAPNYVKLYVCTFLMEIHMCNLTAMVYLELVMSLLDFFTSNTPWYFLDFALQIVGIPLGTNHTVYCTRFIFYCKERDFMSNLKKYKTFGTLW